MVFEDWSGPPSLPRQFLSHNHTPFGNKKVLVPLGGTRTERQISAVPPCLPSIGRPLCPVPTHRLPVNAGNASEDTLGFAHFPLPSAAHLLSRFSPCSQLCRTLCGCAYSFTSASLVCLLNSLYDILCVCQVHFSFMGGKTWRRPLRSPICYVKCLRGRPQGSPLRDGFQHRKDLPM